MRWFVGMLIILHVPVRLWIIAGPCSWQQFSSLFLYPVGVPQIAPVVICPCLTPPGQPGYQQNPSAAPSDNFTLTVDSLAPGSALPEVYSCKGAGESPAISWGGIPAGTKSLVLILEDPDAPTGTFTHWLVYNIPVSSNNIPPGQTVRKVLENGAQQGDTTAGSRGYYPPCPPIGTTHRYLFRLYAVDMDIAQPTADRESIDMALQGHTIAKTEFLTMFKR